MILCFRYLYIHLSYGFLHAFISPVLTCRTDSPSSQAVIPLVHATSMMTWCDIEYNDYSSTSICLVVVGGSSKINLPENKVSSLILDSTETI